MLRTCFRVAVFLSAFLLFQLQPLVAKSIAPAFGGSVMVWTSCMLFFQVALLGGYLYAHGLGRLPVRSQAVVHWLILAATLPFLTVLPRFEPQAVVARPLATLVLGLAGSVGATFLILSATAPLLQRWYATLDERGAYRLYADSNAGSLLGLLSYPFLFEPLLNIDAQGQFWIAGAVTQLLLFGVLAASLRKANLRSEPLPCPIPATSPVRMLDGVLWILLSAAPCAVMLAVTSKISLEVAPVPLLWVVPLALYLVTFILCFGRRTLWPSWLTASLTVASVVIAGTLLRMPHPPLPALCAALDGVLFFCCLLCHGELARRKPDASRLTRYYLAMSLGGVLGTLFVAIGAPLLFETILELPLVVAGAIALPLASQTAVAGERNVRERGVRAANWIGLAAIAFWLSPDLTGMLQEISTAAGGRAPTRTAELGTLLPLCILLASAALAVRPPLLEKVLRRNALRGDLPAVLAGLWRTVVLGGVFLAAFHLASRLLGMPGEFRPNLRAVLTNPVLIWGTGVLGLGALQMWAARKPKSPTDERRFEDHAGRCALATSWRVVAGLLVARIPIEATVSAKPILWSIGGLVISMTPSILPRRWISVHRTAIAVALLAAIQVPLLLSWFRLTLPYGSAASLGVMSLIASLTAGAAIAHLPTGGLQSQEKWLTLLGVSAGVAAALLMPQATSAVVLAGCGLLAMAQLALTRSARHSPAPSAFASVLLVAGIGLSCGTLSSPKEEGEIIVRRRNFYGTLRVEEHRLPVPVRDFIHGSVSHGRQYLEPARQREPTMYYHQKSGIGRLLEATRGRPRSVAAVGLGIGTIASYGETGDRIRFFEIDPDVETIARNHFSFLRDSTAEVDVVVMDGRLALERDRRLYDIVVLDAFSGDAIPTHLLTTEALGLYLDRLQPEGFLALHISNSHLDLTPIVNAHASEFGLNLAYVDYNAPGPHPRSLWAILSRTEIPVEGTPHSPAISPRSVAWTDRRHSLLGVLRARHAP